MINRTRRIPKDLFNTKGAFYHSTLFTLKVSPYKGETRVSVSVSKKVSPFAVQRNKIRRRVYSVLGSYLSVLSSNHLLFFQAKKGAEQVSFDEIKKNVTLLLKPFLNKEF